ncbi:MAG: ABC transporter ATP-binding protein [Gammaproteobacteria bacterium]|nr:ABC transporter ATP-binding protein [Gammaproteobacteria bacterium]
MTAETASSQSEAIRQGDPLIEARQLGRDYAGTPAVSQLDFRLDAGEIMGFLGPNGAGKSTTMRMLAGVLAPSHGKVSIAGIDLLEEPLRAKRMLGYLPEIPPLYPELTVASYLRFAAELRDVARHDLDTAVDDALDRCGLGDMRSRIIGNLSKGYQQRVGIAQAIVHDPAVVILDEPTVGLDPLQINGIRELITALGRQHTVILSTHILQEVKAVCSRVLLLHRGRVQLDRSMDELGSEGGQRIRLKARQLPDDDAIRQHLGNDIERLDATTLLVGGSDPEALAEKVVAAGWGLLEVQQQTADLESLFQRLVDTEREDDA